MRKFLKERDGFKVGDRVKVFNYYIKEFNGMTGTIYKIDEDVYLNFDVILDNFTDGHDGHAGDRSTNHRFFSTKDLVLLSSTTHNVGDWVQVRSYLSTEKSYGGIYPSEQMLHKVGQKVRIKAVTKTGRYKIEGSCFTWTNEMFEEAKKVVRNGTDTKPTSENEFDWDKFKDNKIIVHCRTQKSWDNFLDECEKRDIRWNGDDRATYGSCYWLNHKDQSSIVKGLHGVYGMTHTSLEWHRKEMPTAVVYDWISKKYVDKPVEEKKSDIKVGDRVKIIGGVNTGEFGVIYAVNRDDYDIIVDNFTNGHSGDANDGSKNHWYTDKENVEKISNEEPKPIPKIEVGDVVRAIDNHYCITALSNEWEGVVISVSNGEFTAITTNHKNVIHTNYDRYWDLDPKHFEIINKNN